MRSLLRRLPLLSLALILGFVAADDTQTSCDQGWSFHDGMCYLMRDEYETFQLSENTCKLYGAQLAYGRDQNSLDYLSKQVQTNRVYGWWYGARVSYQGNPLLYNEERGFYLQATGVPPPLPKDKKLTPPSTSCVGIIQDTSVRPVDYIMVDVPCNVQLPYVCRGDPKKVDISPDDHFYQNDTLDVFWFSSLTDRRSHQDAAQACKDKSMTLASIRGTVQMAKIVNQLKNRTDEHADPWWIGLQVNDGVYSWSSQVYMEIELIIWDRNTEQRTHYKPECRILLTDGTLDNKNCYETKAPFICMKPHMSNGMFGCDHKWTRAGGSCYLQLSTGMVTHQDADKLCAKVDSHPISVNTPLEKIWLMNSDFMTSYNNEFWTSLNDKKTPGQFLWTDGSSPSPSVLSWSRGDALSGDGQCFTITPKFKTLRKVRCQVENYIGCQYPSENGQCVSNKWKYYQGNCYFDIKSSGWENYKSFPVMLHKCYADVVKYDTSIVVSPLKVDNADILTFLEKIRRFGEIWTGLQEKSRGVYTWSDGTPANISIFNTRGYTNQDTSTSQCCVVNSNGDFEARSCETCKCARAICEKEISAGNSVTSHFLVQFTSVFATIFTAFFYRY